MATEEPPDSGTQAPNEDDLEETKRVLTLYFIVASVILGILLFIAIRKSVKLCFFDYFYTEPEIEENDFKPATVFTVPSLLQNLQKRYEEMNKSKKKRKKHIPVHVTRRADDTVGLTASEVFPGSHSPLSERMSPPSVTKERPKLFSDMSNPSTLERSQGRTDAVAVTIEESNQEHAQVHSAARQEDDVIVESRPTSDVISRPTSSAIVESRPTSGAPDQDTEEEQTVFINDIYESQAQVVDRMESQQQDEQTSERGSYGYESVTLMSNRGIVNAAFEDDPNETEDRISYARGEGTSPLSSAREDTTEDDSSSRELISREDSKKKLENNLARFSRAKITAVEPELPARPSRNSHLSDDELRVFVPGVVASIAKNWQKRKQSIQSMEEASLPGVLPLDEDEDSQEQPKVKLGREWQREQPHQEVTLPVLIPEVQEPEVEEEPEINDWHQEDEAEPEPEPGSEPEPEPEEESPEFHPDEEGSLGEGDRTEGSLGEGDGMEGSLGEGDGKEGSLAEGDAGIQASFVDREETAEEEVEDELQDDVFEPNPSSRDSSNGSNVRFGDPTMVDVEILHMSDTALHEDEVNNEGDTQSSVPRGGSENSTPAASLLMMSDEDKADLFTDDPLGLALADIDQMESGSELGSGGSQCSGEGSTSETQPKSPKLGQFGKFKMDWGTSNVFAMTELPQPKKRYKSRYKKNPNPMAQKITPHRANRNWGKMMKELYDVGDF